MGLQLKGRRALVTGGSKGIGAAAVTTPMGRIARQEEIADAAVFPASPRARFISEASVMVHGTLTRRAQG